jgi:cytochrome c5
MGAGRVLLIVAIAGALGVSGIATTAWLVDRGDSVVLASAMPGGGGQDQYPMNEMMQRMIPDLVPPGVNPQDLPDPDSPGAKVLVMYCGQCHNLPAPTMHTAAEWPSVVDRMMRRMSRMSGMGGMGMTMQMQLPSPEAQQTLVSYLEAHSLKSMSPKALPSSGSKRAKLFRDRCSQCHSLPDPKAHTRADWPATVDKMQAYMRAMDKKVITKGEEKEIVGYLQDHARK